MQLAYTDLITESASILALQEWSYRGPPVEIRLKILRLLKESRFVSHRSLAPLLGYSERQLKRTFDVYREGVQGLLDQGTPGGTTESGSTERMTPEAWADLKQKMITGKISRFEDARRYLAEMQHIRYASITSISSLSKARGKAKDRMQRAPQGRPREAGCF